MSGESCEDPLTLHDQPKSEDDCGTCSARLLMDQGRIVHTGGNWKLTSSVAEDTHTSDISATMPGEEPSSSTSSYDVPSSSYQTPARQQREYERIHPLYREPSQEEIDDYRTQVRERLLNARQKFPSGHGLMVGFSSMNGCQGTQPLKNIHNSRKYVCRSYKRLGYATCFFSNPNRAQMLAVYQELAQSDILEHFKVFVSYYTGHGQHNYISLEDGYLSIASLKNVLSNAKAPNLRKKVRSLIFDCCRVNANVEELEEPKDEENLFIFYTVPVSQQSFVVDAAGLSVATSELIKMLDEDQPRSIKEFFMDLKQNIPRAVKMLCNVIDCGEDFNPTITEPVNFFQDMISSMSATEVVLTDDPDSEMCLLTWRKPQHADHHKLTEYFVASQEENSTWIKLLLQENIKPEDTQLNLRRDQVLCKRLSIGAKYEEREVIAADHGVCPAVYLLSEDIKPENVHLNMKTKKEADISWENCATSPHGDKLFVSLDKRHKQRTGRLKEWDCLENKIKCDDNSYSIRLGNPDSYDYRIRRHMDDMYSEWVTPIRRDIGREQRMKTRLRCLIVPAIVLSIVLMITTILAIVTYSLIIYVVPSSTILAIPGDGIDCENLKPEKTKLYSNVKLKQETDDPNDNDDGIALIVTSIKISETQQNSCRYTGNINTTLSGKKKHSIIEDTYYTKPIYTWKGSNISMQVDIKEYTTPPTKTEGYIICGEENYLSFHNNKDSFHYVHKFSISRDHTVLPSTTVNQSCYCYVGIRIYAESSVRVLAVINMDYFYVNSSNPAFSQGISLSPTDGTVKYPIDLQGNKIVVCGSEKPVDSSILSAHFKLKYDVRNELMVPLVFLFVFIVVVIETLIFLIYIICPCCKCTKNYHNNYVRLKQPVQQFA